MSEIHNSNMAFECLKNLFNPDVEEFWLLPLDVSLTLKAPLMLSRGTLNYCLVHPRDIFREAIRSNAYALIVAHNHPSLQVQPSLEDIQLTKKLLRIAKLIEIPIIDHIIFTNSKYFSFKENNLICRK